MPDTSITAVVPQVVSEGLPFWEAMRQMVENDAGIRRAAWDPDVWMDYYENSFVRHGLTSRRDMHYIEAKDVFSHDWQVVSLKWDGKFAMGEVYVPR